MTPGCDRCEHLVKMRPMPLPKQATLLTRHESAYTNTHQILHFARAGVGFDVGTKEISGSRRRGSPGDNVSSGSDHNTPVQTPAPNAIAGCNFCRWRPGCRERRID